MAGKGKKYAQDEQLPVGPGGSGVRDMAPP